MSETSDQTYPWLKFYPEGVSQQIDPNQYNSIIDILEDNFNRFKDLPAYVNMGKSMSYDEVDRLSKQFANYLTKEVGLKAGDRVAIQMPNLLQYPVAMFGVLRAGLVVVNTNPLYTPHEMKHQFSDSGAVAIIILANFAFNLEKILPETQIKTVIVTEIGDMLGGLKKFIVNFVVKNVKKMVPAYSLPGSIKFSKALKAGARHSYQKPDITIDDFAYLQYTGGTTGISKGAALTHKNIVANLLQSKQWFVGLEEGKEVVITALPLYHIFALTVNCLLMSMVGAKNILVTNPRDMPAFLKDLKANPFSIITGVNTLFNGLLNQDEFRAMNFSLLKYTLGGGMAVQKVVAEKWEKVTGSPLAEGYGLSETSPLLSCNPLGGGERIGTIGVPVPSTNMAILDEDGNDVPNGEPGEICAKGPQVMLEYWKRPEETAKVFHGEWFRTGDIGIKDEDGFFKIIDRKKDMILVSGFNVYPNEIEDVVASHEKVLEVAAVGVADEKSTEAVKLYVVKKDKTLTEDEVKEHCTEFLTNYKRPKYVEFIAELPKSNVGKILRRHLRERMVSDQNE